MLDIQRRSLNDMRYGLILQSAFVDCFIEGSTVEDLIRGLGAEKTEQLFINTFGS